MTVSDLMRTSVITIEENDEIGDADLRMHLASIRHIVVVDERRRLVGMLSNRDLARAFGRGPRRRGPVRDIMTRAVRTVRSDAPLGEAADLMIRHKIGALPVVGPDGRLLGIVTETDFLVLARDLMSSRGFAGDRAIV